VDKSRKICGACDQPRGFESNSVSRKFCPWVILNVGVFGVNSNSYFPGMYRQGLGELCFVESLQLHHLPGSREARN
jgi:hypothetical protein